MSVELYSPMGLVFVLQMIHEMVEHWLDDFNR